VRYTGIFFGMLTLAFGMLFHSFLFKFYYLTGGDSGMRVARMNILGLEFARYNKIEFLAGPFYYYCLGLMIVAGFLMWRVVNSPFGLHLKTVRDNARKAEYLGVHVHRFRLAAFVISAAFGAAGGAILGFRVGLADPELVYWTQSGQLVFMAVLGGFSNFFGPIVGALTFTAASGEDIDAGSPRSRRRHPGQPRSAPRRVRSARGRTGLSGRAQWRRQDDDAAEHHGLSQAGVRHDSV
jgi:branched-chain amino acid transport system permease protein